MYYWVIWLFEKFGLVWDVRRPPAELYLPESRSLAS